MTREKEFERLLLPWDPPLPHSIGGQLPPMPALWERAKVMFEQVISHIGSAARCSRRGRVTRPEKRDLIGWLYPVEKLVRGCLVVKALNFLLMTVEGRRLMCDTPRIAMPQKHRPPGAKKTDPYVETIPHPGWSTIAQHRLALARQVEREDARAMERAGLDPHDPAGWSCPFRIVGWKFPEEPSVWTPPKTPSPVRISLIEPIGDALCNSLGRSSLHDRHERGTAPLALRLARRVEALSRAIADPERSARTLARFLARLPREALQGLAETSGICKAGWKHGFEDNRLAAAHIRRAATVLLYEPELQPKPG